MCWGFCSSMLRTQKSEAGSSPKSVDPWGRLIDSPGRTATTSDATPSHRGRDAHSRRRTEHRPDQPARSQDQGELQANRWMDDRRQCDCGRRGPPSGRRPCHGLGDREPAQRQGHLTIENHRLEEMVRADVAGLGRKEQADGDPTGRSAEVRPHDPRQSPDGVAGAQEGHREDKDQAGRQAERPGDDVQQGERAPMRVELVEGPHEWVIRVESGSWRCSKSGSRYAWSPSKL